MHKTLNISASPNQDGSFDVTLKIRKVRPKQDKAGKRFYLYDLSERLPMLADCGGKRRRVFGVIKLFCDVPLRERNSRFKPRLDRSEFLR